MGTCGTPQMHQGMNFVGAEAETKKALLEMDHKRIESRLLKESCGYVPFVMNAPSASHTGGIWEHHIRSIHRVLSGLMVDFGSQLDDDSLKTLMLEAMNIVNSRPLSVDNLSDPSSQALTPNMLLTSKPKVLLPPPGKFCREDVCSQCRWRRVQYILNQFWLRWRHEYLQNLDSSEIAGSLATLTKG